MFAALNALAERHDGPLRVVVGLGLHRPMTAEELAPLAPFDPVQSDPDDAVAYGEWRWRGHCVPGLLTRAATGPLVSIGICELHQYAGVSGGHKGAVVGCGGRGTIAALHDRDVVTDPAVRLGEVEGNPFRSAIDDLGRQLGLPLCLGFVPQRQQWFAGNPVDVVRAAAAALEPWEEVEGIYEGAVLHVPPAKAGSLYQASRAATYLALSPRPPLAEGATLVLDAACPEGPGAEAGFVAALSACQPPWTALLTGPPPTGAGAQRAVMLALLARRYRLLVRGCVRPQALVELGIDASAQTAPSGAGWLDVPAPFRKLPQRPPSSVDSPT